MKIGFGRVTTQDQKLEMQLDALQKKVVKDFSAKSFRRKIAPAPAFRNVAGHPQR